MSKKSHHILGFLLLLLAGGNAQADDGRGPTVAITANGSPVMELYRNPDGGLRYQLNNDLALGMSLGISPIRLANRVDSWSGASRWLPVFDLNRTTQQPDSLLLDQSRREARQRQWFVTLGSSSGDIGDGFDFQSDLAAHFSLQTKAGFLIPFGRRWLLGGAFTLDHSPEDVGISRFSQQRGGTSMGAFLGIEFSY